MGFGFPYKTLALVLAAVAVPAAVHAEHVIDPGQEGVIGRMVGLGGLPGACQVDHVDVRRSAIEAHYRCDGREAVLEVRHPDQAPADAVRTRSFAIVPGPGASGGLVDLIRSRVVDAESAFRWTETAPDASPSAGNPRVPEPSSAEPGHAVLGSPGWLAALVLVATFAVLAAVIGARARRAWLANATRAAWGVARRALDSAGRWARDAMLRTRRLLQDSSGGYTIALFAPHLVLGAWLRVVPDDGAFRVNQAVVLVHVVAALCCLPFFLLALRGHASGRLVSGRAADAATVTRIVLVLAVAAAFMTGAAALWSGDIGTIGRAHAFWGMLPALPLGIHLLQERRRLPSIAGVALILLTPLSVTRLSNVLRLSEAAAAVQRTPFQLVDPRLYDTADWCGGCHTAQYAEWSRSTHASAMFRPRFRENLARAITEHGRLVGDTDVITAGSGEDVCVKCHSPKTFYGDDERPALEVKDAERNGVGCSFCHTVAAIEPIHDHQFVYVSAPDSVRRYLFQNSSSRILSVVGDLLIRWRPDVHRRDYHRPIMDTGELCRGCHVDSFLQWQRTPFAAGWSDPGRAHGDGSAGPGPTQCQDCHMTRVPTGEPVRDPGRLVAWGPIRPQRRNHWFRGGNVAAALQDGDAAFAELERDARRGAFSMRILDVKRDGGGVTASVAIRGDRLGHLFLTGEGVERHAWLAISAVDPDGREIATSGIPPLLRDAPAPPASVTSVPVGEHGGKPADYATTNALRGGEERQYEIRLLIGDHAPEGTRLEVALRNNFDPEPLLRARAPLPSL